MTKPELVRLSKLMSERGLASRREADRWIEKGWVLVNGEVVRELGTKVPADAEITLSRPAQETASRQKTFLLNKPVGYVSTQPEKGYKEAASLLTPENRWEKDPCKDPYPKKADLWLRGLSTAGRLDIDSEGLLILTQNGRLVKQIIGPNSDVEKEYLVRFEGTMDKDRLRLLRHGLKLDGKDLLPAQVEMIDDNFLKMILKEGRKRQIRRMMELVGLKVLTLKRVRIGDIVLGDLPRGKWRHL
jgi:23S rRNA pseudouridine2604 synthase